MKRVMGALIASGALFVLTPHGVVHAGRSGNPESRSDLKGWLHAVTKVEGVVVKVGTQLQAIGSVSSFSGELVHVRRAEGLIRQAIGLARTAPRPPAKYAAINRLLEHSLQEYRDGLKVVDRGFVAHNTSQIMRGLKTVNHGTIDQNRLAKELKKIGKA